MIPKKIFQTFETKDLPHGMAKATESWKQKNPDYEYTLFDKHDRVEFIKTHYGKEVLDAYFDLIPGAFRADLWRLCVLYVEGGVYIDADTICELPLDQLIEDTDKFIITRDDPMAIKWLGNAFIGATKGHPILKDAIYKIVEHCQAKQEMFYLDYSGPALMGKVVNKWLGRDIEHDYELGKQGELKIMRHDFGRTKYTYDGKDVLHVEYPGKVAEMDSIGNKKFWDYVQAKRIYQPIPRRIIYTTQDILDVNEYMTESFKQMNPEYEFLYFDDDAIDTWFANSIYNDAFRKLKNKGERTDFFRYCYLFENGGVWADADTYCNKPLDEYLQGQKLVVGLEACVDLNDEFFKSIGVDTLHKKVSVANWFFAMAPKHPIISNLINDIINNPIDGVLQNTGPGRFTKHIINYVGKDHDFTKDVNHEDTTVFSINRFGSNQSHSNAIRHNVLTDKYTNESIFVTHLFDGAWRDNTRRKKLKKYKQKDCSHNLSLWKTETGYKGIARRDEGTDRTKFMDVLGDCRTLYEFDFDKNLNLVGEEIKDINHPRLSKWEDYRTVWYKEQPYHFASYIDENWNTTTAILNHKYNVVKQLQLDEPNIMSFVAGKEVVWYKNLLPFIHDGQLHFIYNTAPRYKVYRKQKVGWEFDKIIDHEFLLMDKFPQDELYFTADCKLGGSTPPIWFEEEQCYIYLVHTKIYQERCYNHFAVKLDKNLSVIDVGYKPFISRLVPYALFFISTWVNDGKYITLSGGLEDNTNWSWQVPKSLLFKTFK